MLFIDRLNSILSGLPSPLLPSNEAYKNIRAYDVTGIWEIIKPKMLMLRQETSKNYEDFAARDRLLSRKILECSKYSHPGSRRYNDRMKIILNERNEEREKFNKINDFLDGIAIILKKIYPDFKQKISDLYFVSKLQKSFCRFQDFQRDLYIRLDSIPYHHYMPKESISNGNLKLLDIENEIESSCEDTKSIFHFFHLYFNHFFTLLKRDEKLEIINYLEGNATLDDLQITKENGSDYLQLVKIIDLAQKLHFLKYREHTPFIRSTYEIRLRILELLSPNLKTIEAFTYTLDANKLKNADFTKDQANWLPERINFYAKKVIPLEYINMKALSKKMNCYPPVIYAFRGTSCAGKTTFSKRILGIGPSDEMEEIRGVMTHDNIKGIIKENTCAVTLTNDQVHDEAARGPLKLYKQEIMQKSRENLILDYRMTSLEELEEVIYAAKINDRVIRIIELDAPLTTLYQRMLGRNPHGKTPCQQPMVIRQGLLDIRQSRRAIINRILQEPQIQSYELYYATAGSVLKIAKKVGSLLKVKNEMLFAECCKIPSEHEMNLDSQIVIYPHLVPFYRIQIPVNDYQKIHEWNGFTLEQAVRYKALAISPAEAQVRIREEMERMARYGKVCVNPFSEEWLIDYPEVLKHVKSEHKLHNRNDIGLWSTTKFSTSLNKNYSPESSIQMKLGYFKVDSKYIVSYGTPAEVMKDIVISIGYERGINWRGGISSEDSNNSYRLFVHPEAYEHFQTLHDAGIPFVTPEESEFIGTPTSSYRSWVVRRIHDKEGSNLPPSSKTVPFIVKFGVGSTSNPSKLLSTNEIMRSIEAQNKLRNNHHLWLFPERFAVSLKDIPDYPPRTNSGAVEPISSGMIIREFPEDLLKGECSIISFQSIQSMERSKEENKGVCKLAGSRRGTDGLPLIYELIDIAIQKGIVNCSTEYIEKFLIQQIFKAFETPLFKDELSLSLHAQNLCLVLDRENIPIGFAYRDFGDVYSKGDVNHTKRFTGSITVAYRFYDLMKILNIISASESEYLPPIPGTAIEVGSSDPLLQKSMNYYLRHQCKSSSVNNSRSHRILSELSITLDEHLYLLRLMDDAYISKLNTYYEMDVRTILSPDGTIPAVEVNSAEEKTVFKINQILLNSRRKQPLDLHKPLIAEPFTGQWLEDYPEVLKHVISEQKLHLRGLDKDIDLWQAKIFKPLIDSKYNPEACIQIKLAYFIFNSAHLKIQKSKGILSDVIKEIKNADDNNYRFFIHPEAYHLYKPLHEHKFTRGYKYFVSPEESEFIGTPTSSYRSWVVRRITDKIGSTNPPSNRTVPFIVKFGNGNVKNRSDKLGKPRSVVTQNMLNETSNNYLFSETLAISLNENLYTPWHHYQRENESKSIESVNSSRMMIREFPHELLDGKCSIIPFQSLHSMERMKEGNQSIYKLSGSRKDTDGLPLIYVLIDIAVQKGVVKSAAEYVERYLIRGMIHSIDDSFMVERHLTPEESSLGKTPFMIYPRNLCLVLDKENIPIGYTLQDLDDVYEVEHILEPKQWFYHLQRLINIITTNNKIIKSYNEDANSSVLRSMNYYLTIKPESAAVANAIGQKIIAEISITIDDYNHLLQLLRDVFNNKLRSYISAQKLRKKDVNQVGEARRARPLIPPHVRTVFGRS